MISPVGAQHVHRGQHGVDRDTVFFPLAGEPPDAVIVYVQARGAESDTLPHGRLEHLWLPAGGLSEDHKLIPGLGAQIDRVATSRCPEHGDGASVLADGGIDQLAPNGQGLGSAPASAVGDVQRTRSCCIRPRGPQQHLPVWAPGGAVASTLGDGLWSLVCGLQPQSAQGGEGHISRLIPDRPANHL